MARPLRVEFEGALYHVTARGNERKKIFISSRDYEKFLQYIADAREKYRFLLHAYVLMGNHYHLIIETPEGNLSRAMHYINSSYTTYTNIKRQRCGHLFQGRFKAILVDKESYLLDLSRYVHLNPVRANMVDVPQAYRHSSYRAYISHSDDLIHTGTILGMLSGKVNDGRERYRQFVEGNFGDDPVNPFEKVYGGMILGNEHFISGVLQKLKDREVEGEEISNRKDLRRGLDPQEVLTAISSYFRVDRDDVLANRRSLPKGVRICAEEIRRDGESGNMRDGRVRECSGGGEDLSDFRGGVKSGCQALRWHPGTCGAIFNIQGPPPMIAL